MRELSHMVAELVSLTLFLATLFVWFVILSP